MRLQVDFDFSASGSCQQRLVKLCCSCLAAMMVMQVACKRRATVPHAVSGASDLLLRKSRAVQYAAALLAVHSCYVAQACGVLCCNLGDGLTVSLTGAAGVAAGP
jgi:hypothetical protein